MSGWDTSQPDISRNADVTRRSDISRTQSDVIDGRFIMSLDIHVCLDQSGHFPHTGGSLQGHVRLAWRRLYQMLCSSLAKEHIGSGA